MAENAKKKVKRLKGVALGELRSKMKVLEKAVKKLEKYREDYLDGADLYKDQVSWPQELVFDADADKVGKRERIVIGRIPREVIKGQAEILKEIEAADEAVGEVRDKYAAMMGVSPFGLDVKTGMATIDDGETVYEDVDPEDKSAPTPPCTDMFD